MYSQGDVDSSLHGLAGAVAALLSMLLLYPIDQARFFLQVEGPPGPAACWQGQTAGAISAILRRGGAGAVYRGIGPMLVTVGVSQGLYFWAARSLHRLGAASSPAGGGLAGRLWWNLVAGAFVATLTNPLWVAALRLKFPPGAARPGGPPAPAGGRRPGPSCCGEPEPRRGPVLLQVFAHAAAIAAQEGPAALWQGLGSSLWLALNPALQFAVYETLKAAVLRWRRAAGPSGSDAFLMGAAAKGCATLATYPLQVAQSRLRVATRGGSAEWGTFGVLSQVMRERGPFGLFAGFEAKIMQTTLNGALMMLFYEKIVECFTVAFY